MANGLNIPVQYNSANGLNIGGLFNTASSGLGIINGLQSNSPLGQAGALAQATSLYGKLAGNAQASQLGGIGGDVLGLYSGIQQGGVAGYTGAAVDAAKLGVATGVIQNSPALQSALGTVGLGLNAYNFVKNYQSGDTSGDAIRGAEVGSYFGPWGALIGGAVGGIASAFGPGKTDPETMSWNSYVDQVSKTPQAAGQVSNPYMFLAGVFDEKGGQSTVPMVAQYGRMGEQKFTQDFMSQIQNAVKSGTVNAKTDPVVVYNKVVAPWISSMNGGKGWNGVGQSYTTAAQGLLKQMTAQFMNGTYPTSWRGANGDTPFYRATGADGQQQRGTGQYIQSTMTTSGNERH